MALKILCFALLASLGAQCGFAQQQPQQQQLVLYNTINPKRVKSIENGIYAAAWLYDRTKVTGTINNVTSTGFNLTTFPVQFDQLKVLKVARKSRKLGYAFIPLGALLFAGGIAVFSPELNLIGFGLTVSGIIMVTKKGYRTKKWRFSVK